MKKKPLRGLRMTITIEINGANRRKICGSTADGILTAPQTAALFRKEIVRLVEDMTDAFSKTSLRGRVCARGELVK